MGIKIDEKQYPAFAYAMTDYGDRVTLNACENAAHRIYGYPEAARDEGLARDEFAKFLKERENAAWSVGMQNAAYIVGWHWNGAEHIADHLIAHAENGQDAFPNGLAEVAALTPDD